MINTIKHPFSPTIRVPLWYYRRIIISNIVLILIILAAIGFLLASSLSPLPPIDATMAQQPYFPFDITLPGSADGQYSTIMH